jgi:hypothetical protein
LGRPTMPILSAIKITLSLFNHSPYAAPDE